MKTALIALAMTGAVLAPTVAAAEEVLVTYDDLNLASSKGQKTLQLRIDAAARSVCGVGEIVTGTRIVPSDVTACYAQARKSANTQFANLLAARQLGG